MRLLPCLAALVLATSPLTTPTAEACGGYGSFKPAPPRAMLVTSHFHSGKPTADGGWSAQRRSFALLAKRAENRDSWRWAFVAPRTYDSTRVRSLGAMPARTLTLVGKSGTRVVTVKSHVELAGELFSRDDVHEATELRLGPNDDFELALDGSLPAATWRDVDITYSGHGTIPGTTLALTRKHTDGGTVFELHYGAQSVGTYRGSPFGVVDLGSSRYVAVRVDGAAQLVEI